MTQPLAAARGTLSRTAASPFGFLPTAPGFFALWLVFDIGLVGATGFLSNWLRFGTFELSGTRALAIALGIAVSWLAFKHVKLHQQSLADRPLAQLKRATSALTVTFLIVVSVGYAAKAGTDISRLWITLWFVWVVLAFTATRTLVAWAYSQLESKGLFDRNHILFTTVENLPRLGQFVSRWNSLASPSSHLTAIFLDRIPSATGAAVPCHQLIRGTFDDFVSWPGRDATDHAVVLIPPNERRRIEPVLERLSTVAIDVDLIAGDVDEVWARRPVSKIAGLPSIRVMTRPLDAQQVAIKRLEDLVLAGAALVALSPLMLIAAIAIRLETPGPVLFRQQRHGFNNQVFSILKFRTMRPVASPAHTVEQARRNDPRITRVGAILRKTSIDELPQLINVIRGEMSFVGPRPHAIQHNDIYAQRIRSYMARHRVKPGITGWAQVNGFRGETEHTWKMRRRIECDLFYVDNWSLVFDIKIILKTLRCLIHPNAY